MLAWRGADDDTHRGSDAGTALTILNFMGAQELWIKGEYHTTRVSFLEA